MNSFHHPERSEGVARAGGSSGKGVPAGIEVARAPYVAGQRYYSPEIEDDADSDSGLLQYWRILGRHKKAIILCAFLGVALGVAIGIPMDPVFRARTSL